MYLVSYKLFCTVTFLLYFVNAGLQVAKTLFWNFVILNLLIKCKKKTCSYRHRELSVSQKQAVIVLIEKKNPDQRQIKNWRPISLINVDVKIGTKAIAKRMEKVLPQITHHNHMTWSYYPYP